MTVREYLSTILLPSGSGGGSGTYVLDVWQGSPMRVDEIGLLDPILNALGYSTGDQSVAGKLDKIKSLAGATLPAGFALTDPRYVLAPIAVAPVAAPTAAATIASPSPTPPPEPAETTVLNLVAPDVDNDGLSGLSTSAPAAIPTLGSVFGPMLESLRPGPSAVAASGGSTLDPTWVIVGLTVLGLILSRGRK